MTDKKEIYHRFFSFSGWEDILKTKDGYIYHWFDKDKYGDIFYDKDETIKSVFDGKVLVK